MPRVSLNTPFLTLSCGNKKLLLAWDSQWMPKETAWMHREAGERPLDLASTAHSIPTWSFLPYGVNFVTNYTDFPITW